MRAQLSLLAGLMIAGAGLACDTSSDAEPRLASCVKLDPADCNPEPEPEPEPEPDPCGYHTETQRVWGDDCDDDAPACFRDEHFLDVFPEGLYVGCGEYTAHVLNPKAVEHALATSGTPRALLKSEAVAYDGKGDPVPGTVLFGEVVALSLNVGFDALPGFKPDGQVMPLGKLVLAEGPCAGINVAQVLDEANLVLGGCPSALTPADAAACVTAINASFVQPNCDDDDDDDDDQKKKQDECEDSVCSSLFLNP